MFARLTGTLLGSDELDGALLTGYFGGYCTMGEEFAAGEEAAAREIAAAAAATGKPLVAHTIYPRTATSAVLRAAGVPVYGDIGAAAAALADLHARTRPPGGVPALPPAAAPVTATGYLEDRAALAAAGVPLGPVRRAATLAEAHAAADELGFPLVLKALGLLHSRTPAASSSASATPRSSGPSRT